MPVIDIRADILPCLENFFDRDDGFLFDVLYGGRGSGKSWGVAQQLILWALEGNERVLCAREFQTSIRQSVKRLLTDTMFRMGCRDLFKVTDQTISCPMTGSEFIFTGLFNNEATIRSLEGVTITWIEEAQAASERSMQALVPTVIRTNKPKIILTMNPRFSTDWAYKEFIAPETIREDAKRLLVNYVDNPWFEDSALATEEAHMRVANPPLHRHIWLGELNLDDDALVFKGNLIRKEFETPDDAEFTFGQDYGFSQDPMAFIRSFMRPDDDRTIYVDAEAGGMTRLDLHDHPAEMDKIMPAGRPWVIKADNSRADYIDWLTRQGFAMSPSAKYKGSVEDGIAWLQSVTIVVHPRCSMAWDELCNHKFQRHSQTDEITRKPEDANNHFIDALRYSWQAKWSRQSFFVGGG